MGTPTIEGFGGNIQVDSTGRRIYGSIDVDLSSIPLEDGKIAMQGIAYRMPAEAKVRIGAAVHLPIFTLAVDVGRSLSLERNSSHLYFLVVGLEVRPLKVMSFHSTIELSTRTIQFADLNMDVPSGTAVVGTSLQLTPFLEFDAALSANTLTYLGTSWETMAQGMDLYRILETAQAGMGIKLSF